MRRWLILRLEAPLLSFGGVSIDQRGPTEEFPTGSLLTGLFANALGWRREDRERHQDLQDRLIFGARWDRRPELGVLTDVQNAQLEKNDKGWTTRGVPEGRAGDSYSAPHRRYRDYHPDALALVVATLVETDREPSLDCIASALERPARPLFFGRKPCLPSEQIFSGFAEAPSAHAALISIPRLETGSVDALAAIWLAGEGPDSDGDAVRAVSRSDRRNWRSGLHAGARRFVEGRIDPSPMESVET